MHLLTTTTLDFAFWALTLLLAVRLLASRDPRWWLAIGACVGAGAEAKWTIGVLGLALIAGFLVTPARSLLRSKYLLLGCLLAAALAAPDLVWQASHGWPNLAVFRALAQHAGHNRIVYWPAQVLYTGVVLTPLWIAGLVWCLRNPAARRFRPAGIAAAACLAVFFVLGGKPYYPGAAYTFLFAAGAVPAERWLAGGRRRAAALLTALALSTALALPVALPVLPARWLHTVPLQKINYDLTETIAWPKLVALVAREYHALPPGQRAAAAILTGNYGEAGAIDRYGPGDGLPAAYSGANSFWYWGPPPARDRSAIAVNVDPALLRRLFRTVRQVATFHNGLGVADDEQGVPVYRATGLTTSWPGPGRCCGISPDPRCMDQHGPPPAPRAAAGTIVEAATRQRRRDSQMRDAGPARGRSGGRRGRRAVTTLAAAALAAAAVAGLAGCVAAARAAPSIRVSTAYVPVPQTPGTTVAYVVIRNNGPADRLVAARTSAGGRVMFQVAQGPNASGTRTVPSVRIPANGTLAMVPDGVHMVITGAGPLHGGRDVTLTLVFARAGPVSVVAQVTNPASGGSSYFLN